MLIISLLLLLLGASITQASPTNLLNPEHARHLKHFYRRDYQTETLHVNGKRQQYQWVCNDRDLQFSSQRVCLNYLQLTIGTEQCVADLKVQLCESGDTRVTGVSWDGKRQAVQCSWAGDSVGFIMNKCGVQGGSAVANHNGNFIVHVNDHWI